MTACSSHPTILTPQIPADSQASRVYEPMQTTVLDEEGKEVTYPVAHVALFSTLGEAYLFEEALQALEARFPAKSKLKIPNDLVMCVTPLQPTEEGRIEPVIDGAPVYVDQEGRVARKKEKS